MEPISQIIPFIELKHVYLPAVSLFDIGSTPFWIAQSLKKLPSQGLLKDAWFPLMNSNDQARYLARCQA